MLAIIRCRIFCLPFLLSKYLKFKIYRSELRSFRLREERRLKVFEDRVLKRIFGLKRDEVTRKWRILHN